MDLKIFHHLFCISDGFNRSEINLAKVSIGFNQKIHYNVTTWTNMYDFQTLQKCCSQECYMCHIGLQRIYASLTVHCAMFCSYQSYLFISNVSPFWLTTQTEWRKKIEWLWYTTPQAIKLRHTMCHRLTGELIVIICTLCCTVRHYFATYRELAWLKGQNWKV